MFDIGDFQAKTCSGVSRRSFIRMGASVPLALGLPRSLEAAESYGEVRAKSVLFVFLWGAPSHLDTCDPKPGAPLEIRGPFATIPTRTPGVHFTELLPQIAQRSNLFTLIRTHTTTMPGHPDAGNVALTGYKDTELPIRPNFGAVVAKHRSKRASLPSFVSLANGMLQDSTTKIAGYGGATLGKSYDPFMVGASAAGEVDLPALKLLTDLTPDRIVHRKQVLSRLDAARRDLNTREFENWSRTYDSAYSLLMDAKVREAFDLTREKPQTRDRYGHTSFGQSALLARRLVEVGVPYIQLNYSHHVEALNPGFEFGWDTHILNFELHQDLHCPNLDRTFSALLDDLHQRGLLKQTLVVCMGEFGRTPRINSRAARDHWPQCYFSIWAGAGLEPNRVLSESDKYGEAPLSGPVVTPLMVGTTIAELCGITSEMRATSGVLTGGTVINELL